MGLFGNKKKKEPTCEMCGKTADEGCGSASKHVVEITLDEPSWLPAELRAQAPGEFTWRCTHCDSFPEMKWPSSGGAVAGMEIHLGVAHYVGSLKGMPRNMQEFSMR